MKKRLLILPCMILISALLVAGFGAYLKKEILTPLHLYEDRFVLEVPFLMLNDPLVRYAVHTQKEAEIVSEAVQQTEPVLPTEAAIELPPVPATEPPYFEITESWFDDALFIGDSRTVGLRDYARLGKADYFCSVGMSVFGVLDAAESDVNFQKTKLEELLKEKKYTKIYISLGLNDCEAPLDLLMDAYGTLVNTVKQLQPDAVIVLQSMITLGREKTNSEWYFSLENLKLIDASIRDFADGNRVHYIDANTYFADEEGYLPDTKSWDGCHFDVSGYQEWAQWILENAKTLNISFG